MRPSKRIRAGRRWALVNEALVLGRRRAVKLGLLPSPPLTPDKKRFLEKWGDIEVRLFGARIYDKLEELEVIVKQDPVFIEYAQVIAIEYVDALKTFALEGIRRTS